MEETPFEALASVCSVLVVGLFILTFIAQNFVIPSGSMEKTLLVGDHLVVDRINLAPPAKWMPLVHYREPKRGDIVVFYKPVFQPGLDADADGKPQYTYSRQAPHRCARRPHSSAQRHRDPERGCAEANRTPNPPRPIIIKSFSTNFRLSRPIRNQGAQPRVGS